MYATSDSLPNLTWDSGYRFIFVAIITVVGVFFSCYVCEYYLSKYETFDASLLWSNQVTRLNMQGNLVTNRLTGLIFIYEQRSETNYNLGYN